MKLRVRRTKGEWRKQLQRGKRRDRTEWLTVLVIKNKYILVSFQYVKNSESKSYMSITHVKGLS